MTRNNKKKSKKFLGSEEVIKIKRPTRPDKLNLASVARKGTKPAKIIPMYNNYKKKFMKNESINVNSDEEKRKKEFFKKYYIKKDHIELYQDSSENESLSSLDSFYEKDIHVPLTDRYTEFDPFADKVTIIPDLTNPEQLVEDVEYSTIYNPKPSGWSFVIINRNKGLKPCSDNIKNSQNNKEMPSLTPIKCIEDFQNSKAPKLEKNESLSDLKEGIKEMCIPNIYRKRKSSNLVKQFLNQNIYNSNSYFINESKKRYQTQDYAELEPFIDYFGYNLFNSDPNPVSMVFDMNLEEEKH